MLKQLTVILVCLTLTACTGSGLAPVISKEPFRVIPTQTKVLDGDSIYSIAWRYGLDYQKIAKWNGIAKPYKVRAGQVLRLKSSGTSTASTVTKPAKTVTATVTQPAKTVTTTVKTTTTTPPKKWNWPAKGKVIAKFSRGKGQNGIKIAGKSGTPIYATAAGEIVYAGEGLRGYGKLIIVKHSSAFLSAYAHNRKILIQEGDHIKSGAQIAEMGDTDADRPMLHFEIRKDGQPVDPLRFLR